MSARDRASCRTDRQVDLSDAASACSCPSRKFPCKHALGLLLLYADGTVARGERPAWVQEWLAGRSARAAARTQRATQPPETAVDPAATAKRVASRERKVDAGVAKMPRWLDDLERTGLAVAQGQPWAWWESTAARMVDAQAKGLANQVHAMAATAASGGHRPDWPARLLDQAGGLVLLTRAWRHRDALPEPTVAALRSRLGFATSTEQVLADGERLTDQWAVVGRRFGEQDRIRSLQQWLVGRQSGRVVTLLSFAAAAARLDPGLPVGCLVEAELALYPGRRPHRAVVVERSGQPTPLDALPAAPTWAAALTRLVGFDTSVVDLTEQLSDPVELLFSTQLGGGTDIDRAVAYGQSLVRRPADTIVVLISDLSKAVTAPRSSDGWDPSSTAASRLRPPRRARRRPGRLADPRPPRPASRRRRCGPRSRRCRAQW